MSDNNEKNENGEKKKVLKNSMNLINIKKKQALLILCKMLK